MHSSRYLFATPGVEVQLGDGELPLLPETNRLHSMLIGALTEQGHPLGHTTSDASMWIVEDFVAPGIELLLNVIGRADQSEVAVEASSQLACLLHDNWAAFERYLSCDLFSYYVLFSLLSICSLSRLVSPSKNILHLRQNSN